MWNRVRRAGALGAAFAAGLWLCGCVPMPVFPTPPVSGRVVDAKSGAPVAGAVVVVRYDARYDDLLPDRDVLGYRELTSARDGSFQLGRSAVPGFSLWPLVRTEARVIGVIASGYRCPNPRVVTGTRLSLALQPARDDDERRESCRPLGARADETPRFHTAWQSLHPRGEEARASREGERELERLLAARTSFGFGENCRGPVVDLALSADGRFVAWRSAVGATSRVEVRAMSKPTAPFEQLDVSGAAERRLAWTARGDLVLWEPTNEVERAMPLSQLAASDAGAQSLWRSGETASPPAAAERRDAMPLEPRDLRDERDSRWNGRSFRITRVLDPESGLPKESLRIAAVGRPTRTLELPGEPCGPRGDFGAPQMRIAADGRTALDLRDTGDGCGATAIDLDTGAWSRLDRARGRVCSVERSVPVAHLRAAARGFTEEVEEALARAGADPKAAYSLRILPDGTTSATSIDYTGALVRAATPRFPIRTPLQKIELGVIGASSSSGGGGAESTPPPLLQQLEPL